MADAETLARNALQLMDEGRLEEWEQTMEPDCEFVAPGRTIRGRAAVRQFAEGFRRAFPDVRHTLESVYAVADTVIVEVTLTGTHTGPLNTPGGEIPPTGKPMRLQEVQVVEMRDGKAAVLRTYFDRMEMMGQLGLLPSWTAWPGDSRWRPITARGVRRGPSRDDRSAWMSASLVAGRVLTVSG